MTKKKLPSIKKNIEVFLTSEEGKLSKKSALDLGIGLIALSLLVSRAYPGKADAITDHVNHSNHSSHSSAHSAHSSCHSNHSSCHSNHSSHSSAAHSSHSSCTYQYHSNHQSHSAHSAHNSDWWRGGHYHTSW